MNRFPFTKWCGITLTLLLSFSFIFPLLIPPSISRSNTASAKIGPIGSFATNPVVPQPASPKYLIISTNNTWVESFALWKDLKGVPTQVTNISAIQTQYPLSPTIRDTAEQIWNYIHGVYTSVSPSTLQWVLLIGDNTTLPSRYVYLPDTTEWTNLSPTLKPTDFYYSVMGDSNWDDDNDGRWGECNTFNVGGPTTDEIGDWIPDVYVGRIPFNDQTIVTNILNKTITYSRNPTSYSTTGWDTFLLAGALSNYDEEVSGWYDGDYTDEAELSDYINDNIIPNYYSKFRFYEDRFFVWNYSTPNSFEKLNNTAVFQGLNAYSPALVNLAGHGSPTDMQRKYDSSGLPYATYFNLVSPGWNLNVTGIAIGDPDNDNFNEIVYTHNAGTPTSMQNGTIWMADGLDFNTNVLVWDLWTNPPPGNPPSYATCVDIGDVWNNNTLSVVVGTSAGSVIIFTNYAAGLWKATPISGPEPTDPVLCIEVGNADNAAVPNGGPGINTDIAWGHQSGFVGIATCFGGAIPAINVVLPIWNYGQAVYSIDVGDPDDDMAGEVTCGTGYAGPDGDVYVLTFNPLIGPPWTNQTIETNVGGIVYGLDTGDAGNDNYNKVVIGVGDGAIYMYEAGCLALGWAGFNGGTDAGTKQTISNSGSNAGSVRCLKVGYVDDNDISATAQVEHISIIAGNQYSGIRKYHANNGSGFIDWVTIQRDNLMFFGPIVSALDVGELSYITGEVTADKEIAAGYNILAGFVPIPGINWFEWPYADWANMLYMGQAGNATSTIPHLVFADSCLTGAYDYPGDSLSDRFLYNMAIGYVGSLRICWYYRGTMANSFAWGLSRWMSQDYWQTFFGGNTNYHSGDTLYVSKINYITAFQSTHTQATWETYHRKNLLSYALFGDPEVDVYTNNPRTLTVTYPSNALYTGDTVFRVMDGSTPVAGATVCLWDTDGSYYEVQSTNSTGHAILHVTAPVPNTVNVTVTAHNYVPFESAVGVEHWIDVSQPTVSYTAATASIDITSVTATCSNPAHGTLDDIEATTHTYAIYDNSTGYATGIDGDLTWTGSEWQVTGLNVSALSIGSYYVQCIFADADVTDTLGPPSDVFTISPPTTPPPPPFDIIQWLMQNWIYVAMVLVIIILIAVIIMIIRPKKSKSEPVTS